MSTQTNVSARDLRIAVVGHTNVGKTSLLRTLTRDTSFGDVSASPGTTRSVDEAALAVGKDVLRFYDTPGLEDSTGLLSHLEASMADREADWLETIAALGAAEPARTRFEQEAKALRQVLASDILFYVIDARDPVRAKHRDELEILMRCGRPMIAVLNFVAQSQDGIASWRETLARTNIHAIAPFDTVAYRQDDEIALYEKARTLLDEASHILQARMEDIEAARQIALQGAAAQVASLLAALGSLEETVPAGDDTAKAAASKKLKEMALKREAQCRSALFDLFAFNIDAYEDSDLVIDDHEWEIDPFDGDLLAKFGLDAGKAAATGAAIGLGVDVVVGGLTLGAAAATGALVGTGIDVFRRYGKTISERLSGLATLRLQPGSIALMTARQIHVAKMLSRRGHGAQGEIKSLVSEAETEPLLKLAKKSLSLAPPSDLETQTQAVTLKHLSGEADIKA